MTNKEPEPIPLLWTSHDDAKERGEFLKEIEESLHNLLDADGEYLHHEICELYRKVLDFNSNTHNDQ